jgi:hypothetical protein
MLEMGLPIYYYEVDAIKPEMGQMVSLLLAYATL